MISVVASGQDAELSDLYREHYRSLVRMAAMLLDDVALAEEAVQDAFVQLHHSWGRVAEPSKRAAYLRSIVLNNARSRARRRTLGRRLEIVRSSDDVSAETSVVRNEDRREVLAALRTLPDRQRECLMLRYYLDLSEAEIADTLGISTGSVKTHTHRGLAALERALESKR
jgi:RNA polymerase sigma-70 factor (sigma-E family)